MWRWCRCRRAGFGLLLAHRRWRLRPIRLIPFYDHLMAYLGHAQHGARPLGCCSCSKVFSWPTDVPGEGIGGSAHPRRPAPMALKVWTSPSFMYPVRRGCRIAATTALWFLAQDHLGEPCIAPHGTGQYGNHVCAKFMSEELRGSLEDRRTEWRIECARKLCIPPVR